MQVCQVSCIRFITRYFPSLLLLSGMYEVSRLTTKNTSTLKAFWTITHSETSEIFLKASHAAGMSLNENFSNLWSGTFLKVILALITSKLILLSLSSPFIFEVCLSHLLLYGKHSCHCNNYHIDYQDFLGLVRF